MGLAMSLMGKGLPTQQMVNLALGTLEKQLIDKEIKSFEDFHMAILHIFSTVNSALPGKHYDVPSREDVQACFGEWKATQLKLIKAIPDVIFVPSATVLALVSVKLSRKMFRDAAS